MTQQRYYATHHDSLPPDRRLEPLATGTGNGSAPRLSEPGEGSRLTRQGQLPPFVQPGQVIGDQSSLRFLEPRRLRRLDVDGPRPMTLSINGRTVGVVRSGKNIFDPPVTLSSGDTLQLEVIATEASDVTNASSGWSRATSIEHEGSARGGRHV